LDWRCAGVRGGEHAAPANTHFERDIKLILADHCYTCHGAGEQKSGLPLDHKAYPLLVGRPKNSLGLTFYLCGEGANTKGKW